MWDREGALCAGRERCATGRERRNTAGNKVVPYGIMGTLGTLVCSCPRDEEGASETPRGCVSRASRNRKPNHDALISLRLDARCHVCRCAYGLFYGGESFL